jgi:Ca2+-transporting ATPase
MGRTATEVTREVADVVLADDNFASIVAAIREGRAIFDNLRKVLVYLLAGNVAELSVMLIAAIAGLPIPLLPLQLLWINLVTDGLPALALVMERPEADVMNRPPRPPREPLLGRPEWTRVLVSGLLESAVVLAVFTWALRARDLAEARGLAFSALVFSELFRAFAARSTTRVMWEVGAFSNLVLLAVVAVSVALQVALHQVAGLGALFATLPMSIADWTLCVGAGLVTVTVLEVAKLVRRRERAEHVDVRHDPDQRPEPVGHG